MIFLPKIYKRIVDSTREKVEILSVLFRNKVRIVFFHFEDEIKERLVISRVRVQFSFKDDIKI